MRSLLNFYFSRIFIVISHSIFFKLKSFFKILRNLSFSKSKKLIFALLSKPLYLIPTVWATAESIIYAEKYFNENHGGRGVANAFRHAAWNILIAKNVQKFGSNSKALAWAKFMTDLHEEVFLNDDFDRLMDLHNNKIGRKFFCLMMQQNRTSKKEMMQFLFDKSQEAKGLTDENDFTLYPDQLVYFDDQK